MRAIVCVFLRAGLFGVTGFTLMAYREDQNGVVALLVAVQRDVAGVAARDDELSVTLFRPTTDQRMIGKDLDRFGNQLHRLKGGHGLGIDQEIGEPIESPQRAGRIGQLRQDFALGFEVRSPRTRARR